MPTLTVSGLDTVLGAAVAALIRGVLPETEVQHGPRSEGVLGGAVVSVEGSDRWLFVTASTGPNAATVEALSNGASAVTTLHTPVAEFEFALRSLVSGGPGHVPLDVVRWMAGEALERNGIEPAKPPLTAREREILQLVARGMTNGEIAEELTISTNTVRTHLHSLAVKFEASNRTRMLAAARAMAVPEAFEVGGREDTARQSA
jgi:DNA-binding NarL/FixJ family response regulator